MTKQELLEKAMADKEKAAMDWEKAKADLVKAMADGEKADMDLKEAIALPVELLIKKEEPMVEQEMRTNRRLEHKERGRFKQIVANFLAQRILALIKGGWRKEKLNKGEEDTKLLAEILSEQIRHLDSWDKIAQLSPEGLERLLEIENDILSSKAPKEGA